MSKRAQDERARKAAEALAEQRRHEARRRTLNIAAVVAVVLVLVVGGFVLTKLRDTSTDVTAAAAGTSDYGVTVGPDDAPHTVVVYEDFLCPYCGALEQESSERLQQLAEDGKVQIDYRPFHLLQPDYSAQAANAFKVVLDAAGPTVALAFHNELYADQPDESGPYPDADWLVEKAVDAGATEADVRAGIEDESQQDWVDAATASAEDTGLQGTPTVLLDGEVYQDGRTMEALADNLVAAVS